MKILICTAHFFPENTPRAFRATELAKEFSRRGHLVTVIARDSEVASAHAEFRGIELVSFRRRADSEGTKTKGSRILATFRSLMHYFLYYPEIKDTPRLFRLLLSRREYDLVISNAFPYSIHLAVALARLSNPLLAKVFVADCGDPLTGNRESRLKFPFYFRYIEQAILRRFNFITIPLEAARKAYPQACAEKIRVIPQGFDVGRPTSRQAPNNAFPVFAYAGSLSNRVRDPGGLLDYLATRVDCKFKFFMFTAQQEMVLPYKKALGEKLEVHAVIPRDVLIQRLREFDFVVNIENVSDVQSPSKLIDYCIAGAPILSVNPARIDQAKVDSFLRGDYRCQTRVDLENYDIRKVASQFITLRDEVQDARV